MEHAIYAKDIPESGEIALAGVTDITAVIAIDKHGNESKPNYIYMSDHTPMSLAGIWAHWASPVGQEIETFSILTTASNSLIQPLHDRMPVILQPADYSLWLSKNVHDPHELERLYQPFPADKMTAYKVPNLVNNPRFDSPACIAKV